MLKSLLYGLLNNIEQNIKQSIRKIANCLSKFTILSGAKIQTRRANSAILRKF